MFKIQNSKFQVFLIVSTLCFLLFTFLGCEAFRKKFVRKSRKKRTVEIVVHPQEYPSEYAAKEIYKKYFIFWRAAHAELINLMNDQEANRKRRIFTAEKILENLQQMQQLLIPKAQTGLNGLILEQENTVKQLDKFNLRRIQRLHIINTLEKQRKKIQKDFHYRDVQEYLRAE